MPSPALLQTVLVFLTRFSGLSAARVARTRHCTWDTTVPSGSFVAIGVSCSGRHWVESAFFSRLTMAVTAGR